MTFPLECHTGTEYLLVLAGKLCPCRGAVVTSRAGTEPGRNRGRDQAAPPCLTTLRLVRAGCASSRVRPCR